ncbi:MAG: class I SAM-dependent methyltransferase [Bryobacteraceae bacterium]
MTSDTGADANLRPNLAAERLHLGCGLNAPADWLNVDGSFQAVFARWPRTKRALVRLRIYPKRQAEIPWPSNVMRLDLRKPLPFETNRFTALYSSHTFEHLYRDESAALARECYRVLKVGGICRIVVPDLGAAIGQYNAASGDSAADVLLDQLLLHPRSSGQGALGIYHRFMNIHNHKWMYDGNSLGTLLANSGFKDVRIYHSAHGELSGLKAIEDPNRIENGAGVAAEGKKL